MINLTNVSHAYDKDPKQYPDARPIEQMKWADFRKLLPNEWKPGLNAPFDPKAAEEAEKLGMEVAIMDGRVLKI